MTANYQIPRIRSGILEIVDREKRTVRGRSRPVRRHFAPRVMGSTPRTNFRLRYDNHPRFPILIKILDARDDLSIQVHPPAALAASLGGQPKRGMWYIADCEPGAKLYVRLKKGVTRESFEKAIADGSVETCRPRIIPEPGESIFIPPAGFTPSARVSSSMRSSRSCRSPTGSLIATASD